MVWKKKRVLVTAGIVAVVGAVGTLAVGVTFGFFSASATSNTNSFQTATVSLDGSSPQTTCTVTNIAPGDATAGWVSQNGTGAVNGGNASEKTCTFKVGYTGTIPAYLGLDLAIAGSGNAGHGLYDGTGTGLQFFVHDNQATSTVYMNGHPLAASGGTASASHLLVSATPIQPPPTEQFVTFSVDWYMPIGALDTYENASSSIALTVDAVGAAHNPEGGTHSTAGSPTTDITWS